MGQIVLTDLKRQYRSIKSEIDSAIKEVIESNSFIKGGFAADFEKSFSQITGSKYSAATGNGTDALYICLKSLGVKSNDEVITAANSFIATSEAISMTGAKVIFADCNRYYTIDPTEIEKKITSNTKAIIPVHLFGQTAEMEKIKKIADKHNLFIIEDAAQAVLSSYSNKPIGSYSSFATYSFFPGKNLGAYGDAGAITTNNKELAHWCSMYGNHGRTDKYDHKFEGINSRLDGIQAAILNVKLKYIEEWTKKRKRVAEIYKNELCPISQKSIIMPPTRDGSDHVYHIFAIRADEKERSELIKHLNSKGVNTGIHYPIALPLLTAYKHLNHKKEEFPNAVLFSKQLLSLPIFPELKDDEIKYICDTIKSFYN
ncbi:DegT/DnrJ/EryC1/StrS family aminotransferase [Marinilabiliaceae bacterium ANBcel2]|nr:DegT/DnrJ/EryC1/StrS family aminotransferase [Marinilabiliaceae bacterium ANBcel2]